MAKDERYVLVPLELWTKIFDLVEAQPLKGVIALHKDIEAAQLQVVDLSGQRQQAQQQPTAAAGTDKQKRGPKKQKEEKPAADPNKPKRGRKPKAQAVQMSLDNSEVESEPEPEYIEAETE